MEVFGEECGDLWGNIVECEDRSEWGEIVEVGGGWNWIGDIGGEMFGVVCLGRVGGMSGMVGVVSGFFGGIVVVVVVEWDEFVVVG